MNSPLEEPGYSSYLDEDLTPFNQEPTEIELPRLRTEVSDLGRTVTGLLEESATKSLRVRELEDQVERLQREKDELVRQREVDKWQITILEAYEQNAIYEGERDGLTKLYNGTSFRRQLDAEISERTPNGEGVALAFIDVDQFKAVNDEEGHQIGDEVLVALAEFAYDLSKQIRKADPEKDLPGDFIKFIPGRLGGDEFAIFAPLIRRDGSGPLTQEEREEMTAGFKRRVEMMAQNFMKKHVDLAAKIDGFGLSIGVVATGEHNDAKSLLDAADAEMYEIKRTKKPRNGHPTIGKTA